MKNLSLPTLKPRNPLVRPALFRKAGQHAGSPGSQRLRGMQELRREIERMKVHSP